jgi:hypothetical protein
MKKNTAANSFDRQVFQNCTSSSRHPLGLRLQDIRQNYDRKNRNKQL